jgi:hypothetical protein
MPWSRSLLLGIALLLASACGGAPASVHSPSPSPTRVPLPIATASLGSGYAPWALNLDFSGEFIAHVTGTAPPDDVIRDECTGSSSASLGSWASTMALDISKTRYALVVLTKEYKGAGVFTTNVKVEVHSADLAHVWQNGTGDSVSFTVNPDEQSGLLDANLTNAATPASKLHVTGRWSCQP